MNCQIFFLLLR